MTTYRVHFFLPYPANSSLLVMEMVHEEKHDSDNDFAESVKQVAERLGVDYAYKEEK